MLQEACITDMELTGWMDSCEKLLVRPTKEDYEQYFGDTEDDDEDEE